jgi:uncharacterized protein YceK
MKKRIISLIMACLLLTGCKSVSIETVAQNLENAKNYNANITLEINGKFNDELIEFKREKEITIDNINSSAIVDATEIENKKKTEETYYLKSSKDSITTYKPYEEYYKSITESKDKNSIYYITAFINKNSPYQYIDKKDGIIHYVVTLNKDRVKDFLNSYYDVDFLTDLDFEVTDNAKLNVYVNNKTKNIESLDVDFTSIIKISDNSSSELDRFYLEIDYSDFNDADSVEIPQKVITRSVDENIINAYLMALDYVKAVNDLSLSETTTTYTDTSLDYGNTKPNSVSLTVLKGKVISGTIIINKYEFKVESGVVSSPFSAQ